VGGHLTGSRYPVDGGGINLGSRRCGGRLSSMNQVGRLGSAERARVCHAADVGSIFDCRRCAVTRGANGVHTKDHAAADDHVPSSVAEMGNSASIASERGFGTTNDIPSPLQYSGTRACALAVTSNSAAMPPPRLSPLARLCSTSHRRPAASPH
jgi:hypothetical protein